MLNKELLGLNLMFEVMYIRMKRTTTMMMMNLKMLEKNSMMKVVRMLLSVLASMVK
jgi:hypothetical protein